MVPPTEASSHGGDHMRRIVLVASTIFGLTSAASGQSEETTIVQIPRLGSRVLFAFKPAANKMECPSINANAITPQVAPRLGRTILAEALVHTKKAVGYVFLISYANGPYEVYFSSYTPRDCALTESQSHGRVFVGVDPFKESRIYYHDLFNELSE
jgi:hypothetical protein